MMQKIFIKTNGCLRRSLDTLKLVKYYELNNFKIAQKPEDADYIVLVACACTQRKEDESFELINRLKEYKGELTVGGCLPDIAPTKFKKFFQGRSFTTKTIDEIDRLFNTSKVKFSEVSDTSPFMPPFFNTFPLLFQAPHESLFLKVLKRFEFSRDFCKKCLQGIKKELISKASRIFERKEIAIEETRPAIAYLRISDGCLGNCTYCSIRKSLGSLRSKPLDLCIKEYKQLLQNGYREFFIVAADTGAYGIERSSSFPELLDNLAAVDKDLDVHWRIMDLHPIWAIRYKTQILKRIEDGKIIYLLSAIQSGSERILKLMKRYANCEDMSETLREFKKASPNLKLETQVIVGFPTETNEDFIATINLIKKVRFDHVYLYAYDAVEDTLAANMDGQIGAEVVKDRLLLGSDLLKGEGISCYCGICGSI